LLSCFFMFSLSSSLCWLNILIIILRSTTGD
jgi:hypothetical protein